MTAMIFLYLSILFWFTLLVFVDVMRRVEPFVKPAWSVPLLTNYQPKNGDILLVHYVGHGLHGVPMAEAYPTHTAFVYVNKDGKAFALESTRFAAPEQPNLLLTTNHRLAGVRMVPLAHFVNSVDSVIYLRELQTGFISSEQVEGFLEWASSLDFETRILDTMTYDVTIAIGFRLVWPEISKWCMTTSKLYETERRKKQVFCSEFVSRLLANVGAVKKDTEHYMISPASYLSTCSEDSLLHSKIFPNLESIASDGFSWKKDQMLVRAGADLKFL
jgi:hypothetical protein